MLILVPIQEMMRIDVPAITEDLNGQILCEVTACDFSLQVWNVLLQFRTGEIMQF